jgi:carbonic anhydrase/acetyltransferase-like protein (isoleucine patch superfamily)
MRNKMIYSFDKKQPEIEGDTYISEHALVIGDVRIDNNCYIGHRAILRGDCGSIRIGPGTIVEEGVIIHASPDSTCQIGEKVTIGHGAVIHASIIGDFVLVGMGAILSIGAEVGERAIIAEGCVVKSGQIIPAHVVVAGNPAKIVRGVEGKDEILWNTRNKLYIDLTKKYLEVGMERLDWIAPLCLNTLN